MISVNVWTVPSFPCQAGRTLFDRADSALHDPRSILMAEFKVNY